MKMNGSKVRTAVEKAAEKINIPRLIGFTAGFVISSWLLAKLDAKDKEAE